MGISWSNLGAGAVLRACGALLGASWSRLGDFLRPSHCHRRGPRGPQDCPKTALCHRITLLAPWGGALGIVLGLSCSRLGAVSGPAQGPQKGPTEGPKAAPRGPQHGSVQYLELSFSRHGGALGAVVGPSWNRLGSLPCPSRGPLGVPRRPPDISKRAQDGFMP